jgi:hypothetical protein
MHICRLASGYRRTHSAPSHSAPAPDCCFTTDGITEAVNSKEEEYGPARLIELFQQPGACVNGLIAEVQRFGGNSAVSLASENVRFW